nr:VUT family protein [Tessaracoccus coleopterorum]
MFCALLLISNVAAVKLIQFGPDIEVLGFPVLPIITDGGALLFPLTYVLGDVLAEVYGWRGARRAIVIGFAVSVLASATFLLVGAAPPADDWGTRMRSRPSWGSCRGSWLRRWPATPSGSC